MARVDIAEVSLEVSLAGEGPPLLFLHGGDYFAQNRGFLERLARRWRVMIPRHPGFGGFRAARTGSVPSTTSPISTSTFSSSSASSDVVLVGSSFGGWIALEMCVRSVERIGRLVLIDTLGVKFGGREQRDIADIYALPADEVLRRTFFDPARAAPDYTRLDDAEAASIASDRAADRALRLAPLYARSWPAKMAAPGARAEPWSIWGQSDGIVAPDYGQKLCRSLPDARFEPIREAGHYPQIERPDEVADAIERFARAEVKS